MNEAKIIEGDCLEVMRGMADNSVDAIVTDPPYFKVKGEAWDNQWDKPHQFIEWIGKLSEQWQRILKPNGSLYVFASPKMAARVECKIGERFNVLNHITWEKERDRGKHAASCKEALRGYFPNTERIIFAEHFGADNIAKGEAGYAAKCDELRGFVFEPLRAYLVEEFKKSGIGKIQFNVICGFSASAGGMASRHYLSTSQWCLPTAEHYAKLHAATGHFTRPYEELRQQYEELRQQYEELRQQYEELRRPFTVTAEDQYTDAWTFPTVQAYKGKHVCEKPLALMQHIIKTSTRPGATVLDCFCGSASTGEACLTLGRKFIGIELDPVWVKKGRERLERIAPVQTIERSIEAKPEPRRPARQVTLFELIDEAA